MRYALLLFALAACRFGFHDRPGGSDGDGSGIDSGEPPPAFERWWQSGSRIRAVVLAPVDGGDPVWNGWFDTMLGTYCQNGIASDGMERCVPQTLSTAQYFSDAACTQPLARVLPSLCQTGDRYASRADAMGRLRVYAVGAQHTGPVYELGGSCMLSATAPDEQVYVLGAELPAAQLVLSQYTDRPLGTYRRPYQGFVDGAAVEIGSLDFSSGSCYPRATGLGPARCQPQVPAAEAVYSDNQCTQRAYFWDRQSYDSPTTSELIVYAHEVCAPTYTRYATTANITGASFYRRTATTCQQVAMPVNGRLYRANAIADPSPMGTLVVGPRRGRLGYIYWMSDEGQAMALRYFDHDLATPCVHFIASDGKVRCLPFEPTRVAGFPNDTCQGGVRDLATDCFGGVPYDGPYYSACTGSAWNVRALPKLATTASRLVEATCTPLDVPTGAYDFATPGATVAPTMFAELMEIIE